MRVTKLQHACLRIEHEGETLIVDPGNFTDSFDAPVHLAAIVITHEHADHWSETHLDRLLAAAPGTPIFAPAGVAAAASAYDITTVTPGDRVNAGAFSLQFFGGTHAIIHESIPVIDNVGVFINNALYYPGDSYAVPDGVDVDVLAAPVGAPWLKIGDAIDFVLAVAPRRSFATHDMTLSERGLEMGHARLTWATEQGGGTFTALRPGDSLEV